MTVSAPHHTHSVDGVDAAVMLGVETQCNLSEMALEGAAAARDHIAGTAPKRVREAAKQAKELLNN